MHCTCIHVRVRTMKSVVVDYSSVQLLKITHVHVHNICGSFPDFQNLFCSKDKVRMDCTFQCRFTSHACILH